ncbi:MAG TPA: hypothetical protein EYP19_14450 [Desulfobacterales bacterium]|nr:hypothetical protein [Desulfobacterales bacterium]
MKKVEELDLERDLPLSVKDMAEMRKTRAQQGDLAAYLDFLVEIKAFETKGGEKRQFYDAVFGL